MIFEGCALEPGVKTHGTSGYAKLWPEDELRKAAPTLDGCVVAGTSGWKAENVIGQVTDTWYEDGKGVMFEAEIRDDEASIKLEQGITKIAPRLCHGSVGDVDYDDPIEVSDVEFEGLFLCPATSEGVPGLGEWTIVSNQHR